MESSNSNPTVHICKYCGQLCIGLNGLTNHKKKVHMDLLLKLAHVENRQLRPKTQLDSSRQASSNEAKSSSNIERNAFPKYWEHRSPLLKPMIQISQEEHNEQYNGKCESNSNNDQTGTDTVKVQQWFKKTDLEKGNEEVILSREALFEMNEERGGPGKQHLNKPNKPETDKFCFPNTISIRLPFMNKKKLEEVKSKLAQVPKLNISNKLRFHKEASVEGSVINCQHPNCKYKGTPDLDFLEHTKMHMSLIINEIMYLKTYGS